MPTNTHEAQYVLNKHVVVGAGAVDGPVVKFPQTDRPGCLMAFITYAPGAGGRTLTLTIKAGEQVNGAFFDIPNNTIALTQSGANDIGLPGHISEFKLTFASAGGAGADDVVSIVLSGLPQGATIT